MVGFGRGGDRRFGFGFESGVGRAISFVGFDFLKEVFDVFVFIFEEVHFGSNIKINS
jgi:hypothetical protein